VLRRVRGWQAAAAQERKLARRQPVLSPAAALSQALKLRDLAGLAPLGPDPVRDREVECVRAMRRRLRATQP